MPEQRENPNKIWYLWGPIWLIASGATAYNSLFPTFWHVAAVTSGFFTGIICILVFLIWSDRFVFLIINVMGALVFIPMKFYSQESSYLDFLSVLFLFLGTYIISSGIFGMIIPKRFR